MEKRAADLKVARAVVKLGIRMKRMEEAFQKFKKDMELRLKLLEEEVRKW